MQGAFSTGLVVSSKLPRFSDLYTLTVASADPESISANKPVEFTKSVTQWSLSSPPLFFHACTELLTLLTSASVFAYWSFELHSFKFHPLCNCFRFTKDGVLVEGLFWKEVDGLINDYAKEPKKSK